MAVTFLTDKDPVLRYDEQTMDEAQQEQALKNLGLIKEEENLIADMEWVNGSYTSICNYTTPGLNTSTTRIRLIAELDKPVHVLKIHAPKAGYKYIYGVFDENNVRLKCSAEWIDGKDTTIAYAPAGIKTVRLGLAKSNNSAIDVTDAAKSGICVTEEESAPASIKVMTFNIGMWGYGTQSGMNDDLVEEKVPHWKRFFKKHDCDILAVQEYDSKFDFSDTMPCDDLMFNVLYKNNAANYPQLLRIFSNLDCSGSVEAYLGTSDEATKRGYVKTYVAIGGKAVCLMNVHLHYQNDAAGATIRAAQIADILRILANEEYFILLGDFNANQGTTEYQPFIDAGYNLANGGFFGYERTWNWEKNYSASANKDFDESVDNIITSPNISIDYTEVLNEYDYLTSDHLPVIANLTIR